MDVRLGCSLILKSLRPSFQEGRSRPSARVVNTRGTYSGSLSDRPSPIVSPAVQRQQDCLLPWDFTRAARKDGAPRWHLEKAVCLKQLGYGGSQAHVAGAGAVAVNSSTNAGGLSQRGRAPGVASLPAHERLEGARRGTKPRGPRGRGPQAAGAAGRWATTRAPGAAPGRRRDRGGRGPAGREHGGPGGGGGGCAGAAVGGAGRGGEKAVGGGRGELSLSGTGGGSFERGASGPPPQGSPLPPHPGLRTILFGLGQLVNWTILLDNSG